MTMMLDIVPRHGVSPRLRRRLLDPFFDGWMEPFSRFEERTGWVPASDITERDKEFVATVELPGVDMKGIDISYNEGVLEIKGEKTSGATEDECCCCSERYTGSFHRDLRIPGKIMENKIDASLKDGILKVVLPKSEESVTKNIEIH